MWSMTENLHVERGARGKTMRTECGREIVLGRLELPGLAHPVSRVTLDVGLRPYDHGEAWLSLTPNEARRLALGLLAEAATAERTQRTERVDVRHVEGESYAVSVRGHALLVDQPAGLGGGDAAATPTELFVASLASCVAFYAGRYLTRHGLSRAGLGVTAEFDMATDRPARVAAVRLRLSAPDLPDSRRQALLAVASHCTVHNSLHTPPEVRIELS
jgi:putative redox protein